jgi:hypothetical protein
MGMGMMKRILILLGLTSVAVIAASTFTTHYNLEKFQDGDSLWGNGYRTTLDTIDSQLNINASSLLDHVNDATDAHDATAISTTVGSLICTSQLTVQAYLDCLDGQVGAITGGTVVTTNTNQTITGQKAFTSTTIFQNGITLTGSFTNSSFSTGVLKSDISGNITSSELVDADIASAAAIDRTKIASGTANHVIINSGAGVLSSEAQLAASRGGTGQDLSASTGIPQISSGTFSVYSSGTNRVQYGASSSLADEAAFVYDPSTNVLTADVHLAEASMRFGDTGGGTNVITMQAPTDANLTGDYTLTLPVDDGTVNQVLVTNGSGVLSWGAGGGFPDGSSSQNVAAAAAITISTTQKAQVIYVQGNGAAVSANAVPFGATDPFDNSQVVVCGRSDTNTVTIAQNDAANGVIMNGSVVLHRYDCITFIYNSTDDRYLEVARSVK